MECIKMHIAELIVFVVSVEIHFAAGGNLGISWWRVHGGATRGPQEAPQIQILSHKYNKYMVFP